MNEFNIVARDAYRLASAITQSVQQYPKNERLTGMVNRALRMTSNAKTVPDMEQACEAMREVYRRILYYNEEPLEDDGTYNRRNIRQVNGTPAPSTGGCSDDGASNPC